MKFDNKKQSIAVIFGGESVEHDISIITGVQALNALDKTKYNIIPIYISKENIWYSGEKLFDIANYSKNDLMTNLKKVHLNIFGEICTYNLGIKRVLCKLSFAYLALHGGIGESGGVQGYLDACSVPYSSCGTLGSSICMDKYLTKLICKSQKISVVDGVLLREEDKTKDFGVILKMLDCLDFPLIVKPNNLGSSIGVSFCKNEQELKNAISFAFLLDSEVLIEQAVTDLQEYNIAVMGNSTNCITSDVEKVNKTNDFLTFENKYLTKKTSKNDLATREIPAKIDKNLQQKICNIATKIFKVLKLKGIVRIDFLFDNESQKIYLNEINTIPGSLSNYLWKSKGYSFCDILEKLKEYSLCEKENKDKKIKNFSSSVLSNYKNGFKINSKQNVNK